MTATESPPTRTVTLTVPAHAGLVVTVVVPPPPDPASVPAATPTPAGSAGEARPDPDPLDPFPAAACCEGPAPRREQRVKWRPPALDGGRVSECGRFAVFPSMGSPGFWLAVDYGRAGYCDTLLTSAPYPARGRAQDWCETRADLTATPGIGWKKSKVQLFGPEAGSGGAADAYTSACGRFLLSPVFDAGGDLLKGRSDTRRGREVLYVAIDTRVADPGRRYSPTAPLDDCMEWAEDRAVLDVLQRADGSEELVPRDAAGVTF